MKKILLFFVFLFSCFCGFSQLKTAIHFNLTADTVKVRHYKYVKEPVTSKIKTLKVKLKFNDEKILNEEVLEVLNTGLTNVVSIDYVYTQYKDKKSQDDLNKKRLFSLYLEAPDVFNQSMACWRFVEQLGFTKDNDASKLFHGFVIKYKEITPYGARSAADVKEDIITHMRSTSPAPIRNVLNRNKNWSKGLIVADYTCSMSEYYIEVMAWFCLQQNSQPASFAFFNDGDGMPNDKKIIGKTGGVHQFNTNSLDTIVKYVYETIKTGCSGDSPENDIEAVLRAIDKNPNAKEVILIADNWSDMRDKSLQGLIKKPVRVILCGTDHGINPIYLNLAKRTKGSVHTMKEDLEDLFKLKEGQRFKLGGQEFVVRRGQIIKLDRT
jgi:hypothetical protein